MQLDKTQIAVRERAMLDILDVSLLVLRVYALPLLITFSFGMLPLMLLNHLLVGWMDEVGLLAQLRLVWSNRPAEYPYVEQFPYRYLWNMMLLVVVEAPLASIFATSYIGQAVFQERPSIRQVVVNVLQLLGRIVWCQLIVRAILPIWLCYIFLARDTAEISPLEVLFIPTLVFYCLCVRAVRPYINEIVILERNPLRRKRDNPMTVGRRSSLLHGASSADSVLRSLGCICLAVMLWGGLYGVFLFLSGIFFNDWKQWPVTVHLFFPVSMWMVALFFTVVRFLSYLDVRIRQEGWEVELKLRAEAAKLTEKMA